MNKYIYAIFLTFLAFNLNSYADENEIFLSLTRKAKFFNELPANISIISSQDISNKKPSNFADLLKNEAGIMINQYGTAGALANVMLRGSTSPQVLVMIDGIRINDPDSGIADISSIPINNIERVEIIRGGASAIYGSSAFGGIINIITKKAYNETPSLKIESSFDELNTKAYKINFEAKQNNVSALLCTGKTTSDGWRDNSKYSNNNIFTRLEFDAGSIGKLDLSGSFFQSTEGVPGPGATLEKYNGTIEKQASSPDATQYDKKAYAKIEHCKQWASNTFKTAFNISNKNTNYTVPSNFLDNEYTALTLGTELQFIGGYGTTIGAEWYNESYNYYDNIAALNKIDRTRRKTALYIQQELNYKNLTLIPSLRYDDNSAFGNMSCPGLTLIYKIQKSFIFSANSSLAWRAPTYNEFYWPEEKMVWGNTTYITKGNPLLKPEEGITSDFGIEFFKPELKNKISFFIIESKNLISWKQKTDLTNNTITWSPENTNKTRQQGIEYELNNKILTGLYQRLNYTYLIAKDAETNKRLTYCPQVTISYELSYSAPWNMRIIGDVKYVSSQFTNNSDYIVTNFDEYTIYNIKISQTFKNNVELWIMGQNIADIKHQTRLNYPLPGRVLSGGASIKF